MTIKLPHDDEAEDSILGIALSNTSWIPYLLGALDGGDFYSQWRGHAFEAIRDLHAAGSKVDTLSIRDNLRTKGLEYISLQSDLLSAVSQAPVSSHAADCARIVGRLAVARRAITVAHRTVGDLVAHADPFETIDSAITDLGQIDSPSLEREPDDATFSEIRARPAASRSPWVIDGLLRQDWRCVLVGREGDGKSVLLRQLAVSAAMGMHPFLGTPLDQGPTNTLIVDLENPDDEIKRWIDKISVAVERRGYEGDGRVWSRIGGIDLRNRASRGELEGVIRVRKPDLVVLGPLYKAYSRKSNEDEEQVAGEVQRVLDDLRTRYGFGLLLETHAPHGSGTSRELRPYGSSLWLRWPELGLNMTPADWKKRPDKIMTFERWRGDRVESAWPPQIHWGTDLPWDPDYLDGRPSA